jgi:hypothetical protein
VAPPVAGVELLELVDPPVAGVELLELVAPPVAGVELLELVAPPVAELVPDSSTLQPIHNIKIHRMATSYFAIRTRKQAEIRTP